MGHLLGYARVSTADQQPQLQVDALQAAGCYRVRRGFPRLLAALGSPAAAPKPSGRSPGRPKGRRSGPALRHPAVKKPTKKARKTPTKAKAA